MHDQPTIEFGEQECGNGRLVLAAGPRVVEVERAFSRDRRCRATPYQSEVVVEALLEKGQTRASRLSVV